MTVLPLGDVKSHPSELVDRVHDHHERVTVQGRPSAILKRLLPPMDDRFSARRGTYRVICRIDDKARVVTVVDFAQRRNAFRS